MDRKVELCGFSKYLYVDGFFSKKCFVDSIVSDTVLIAIRIEIVSKLRKDSRLQYLYDGKPTGKRGRPRKYDGRVDLNALNHHYFKAVLENGEKLIYESIVWADALKRKVKLAYVQFHPDSYRDEQGALTNRYVLLFSTNLALSGV